MSLCNDVDHTHPPHTYQHEGQRERTTLTTPTNTYQGLRELTTPTHPTPTYQHEGLREDYAIELDDVPVIEGSHGVGLLDEETLHLLLAIECLDGHSNLQNTQQQPQSREYSGTCLYGFSRSITARGLGPKTAFSVHFNLC